MACAGSYRQQRRMDGFCRLFDLLEEETCFGLSTKTTMPHKSPSLTRVQVRPLAMSVDIGGHLDVLQFLRFRRKELRGRKNCADR